jgi:hypothetical protein
MPRSKNYVNQNKGMTLQAPGKEAVREVCFFGRQCKRPDCIYMHPDGRGQGNAKQRAKSDAARPPCQAFLAEQCPHDESVCHKRHPPPDEIPGWLEKYSKIQCRNGTQKSCPTKGCLYGHAERAFHSHEGHYNNMHTMQQQQPMDEAAFPPLGASFPALSSTNKVEDTAALKSAKPTTTIASAWGSIAAAPHQDMSSRNENETAYASQAETVAPHATSTWGHGGASSASFFPSSTIYPWSNQHPTLPQSTAASSPNAQLSVSAKEFVPSFLS